MSSRTCPTLLERLRDAADPVAWGDFFRRYWPVVHGYARARGCSEHTAEEIVQEVMLKVFEQREVFRYDPARGRFRDWLHRVARNCVAERRRRPSERARAAGGDSGAPPVEPQNGQAGAEASWDAAFEQTLLAALLDMVRRESNPRDFAAFELAVLHERSPAEVARVLGITRNMVYKARRALLGRLRELAGDYAHDGRLCRQLRAAMAAIASPAVERAVTRRIDTLSKAQ